LLWISLTTITLDSPQDLFACSTQPTPTSLYTPGFCNSSELLRFYTPHFSVFIKHFCTFILASSSESVLGFPP
jgi:hypothetical protein